MKVILIEDEILSAEHMARMLHKLDEGIEIVASFDTVKKSVEAFKSGLTADLLFLDIHLADGLSFELFSQVEIDIPVIFTTAYSEYAIQAFKVNSIDYLLKPISFEDVRVALEKHQKLNQHQQRALMLNLTNVYKQLGRTYKSRFMVKSGNSIDSIKTEDILHFVTAQGVTFLVISNGKRYPIDYSLDQIEDLVSASDFFRINRKTILSIKAIQKVSTYFNGRLMIDSLHLEGESAVVSRERVTDFKLWLDQ